MNHTAGGNAKQHNHSRRVRQTLIKLNTYLSSDPAIVLLGTYPREIKTYVHTKIYTGMVTAAYS